MGTALLILLLLALCGFIAYVGDLLGRRLGKKRLTVFGLRPKHTAVLLTVVTGVVIAGLTFGAALVSLPWFRQVVTQGERLAGRNRELERESVNLQAQNARLAQENAARTRQNQELRHEAGGLKTQNGKLAKDNTNLAKETQSLREAGARLKSQNQELGRKNAQLAGSNRDLAQQNSTLRTEAVTLRSERAALEAKNNQLNAQNQRLAQTQKHLAADNNRLRRDQKQLVVQVSSLEERLKQEKQALTTYQSRAYIFRRDTQIASRPIPHDPPADTLQLAVEGVLTETRRIALQRLKAVSKHPVNAFPVIRLVEGQDARGVTEEGLKRSVLAQASRLRNKPLALGVIAAENCVAGLPIPVRVRVYSNDLVFRRRQVVAQRQVEIQPTMDPTNRDAWIVSNLVGLLTVDVSEAAFQAQMEPQDGGFGDVLWGKVLDALAHARRINGDIILRARARMDTYKAGPLNLDIEVVPVDFPNAGAG